MTVMMRSMLEVADNSGARKLQMILPLGGGTKPERRAGGREIDLRATPAQSLLRFADGASISQSNITPGLGRNLRLLCLGYFRVAGDFAAFQLIFLTCLGCTARCTRPFARRAWSTFRPPAVAMRARKPCTRWRRRILG